MNMEHLLGKNWESYRWYPTAAQRDAAMLEMLQQPRNYRSGDSISQVLEKVERQ